MTKSLCAKHLCVLEVQPPLCLNLRHTVYTKSQNLLVVRYDVAKTGSICTVGYSMDCIAMQCTACMHSMHCFAQSVPELPFGPHIGLDFKSYSGRKRASSRGISLAARALLSPDNSAHNSHGKQEAVKYALLSCIFTSNAYKHFSSLSHAYLTLCLQKYANWW